MLKKLFVIFLVLMILAQPVLCAEIKDTSKKDDTAKNIDKPPKELKDGDIKIKDSDTSKYKVEVTDVGISVKAKLDKKDDKKELSISEDAVKKNLKNYNGKSVYFHHFLDDGSYDGYKTVYLSDGYFTADAEFSETLVSSYSGYRELTISDLNITDTTVELGESYDDARIVIDIPNGENGHTYNDSNLSDYIYTDNLTLAYGFGGDTVNATTVLDISGNEYHGTISGATRCADQWGRPNSAMQYTDRSQMITVDSDFNDVIDGEFSIIQTVKIDPSRPRYASFLSSSNYIIGGNGVSFGLYDGNVDNTFCMYFSGIAQYLNRVNSVTPIPAGFHVIGVTFSADKKATLFLDGNACGTKAFSSGYIQSEYDFTLGKGHYGSLDSLIGIHDTNMIYNNALTPAQLKAISTQMMSGITGTSVTLDGSNYTALNGTTTINSTGTVDSIRIMSTTPAISDVTVQVFFTEDTTLSSETEGNGQLQLNITQTAGHNATSGHINYTFTNSSYTVIDMDSTNPNATVSLIGQDISIATGMLRTGDQYWYNLTLTQSGVPVANPTFVVVGAGAFFALAFGITSWIDRRRSRWN